MQKGSGQWLSRFTVIAGAAFPLCGCLYTTHHFNSGRLLEPGHSSVTLGAGRSSTPAYGCADADQIYSVKDSTGLHCVRYNQSFIDGVPSGSNDTLAPSVTAHPLTSVSLDYRLGIHGRMGPLTGAEIGLRLEAPTNPVTAEFDLKLGLPVPHGYPYHHSLSAGWAMGLWADNTWFLEYAASRAWRESDLFFNYRASYLASQPGDLVDAEQHRRFTRNQRLIHQAALGIKWALPAIPVLPDFLIPEAGLTYPQAPADFDHPPAFALDDRMWSFALGMGWNFP